MTVSSEAVMEYCEFPTIDLAFQWAAEQTRKREFQQCKIAEDRFKSAWPRKNKDLFQLFGVTRATEQAVRKIEPEGEWHLEIEPPGTPYTRGADIFAREVQTTYSRMSLWYSRFLPYAVAMVKAETAYDVCGICFADINSHFGTCLGFCNLGLGESDLDVPLGVDYRRIVKEDTELFSRIYDASTAILAPGLPFDECLRPCYVYVAMHRPKLALRNFGKDHYLYKHALNVFDAIKIQRPKGF